jgi:hypothetical protein
LSPEEYPLIDLLIIGAQKSFTTSLKMYLGEHPSVITHPQQEMAYFTDDREYFAGYKKAISHYFKGISKTEGKRVVAKNAILYTSEEAVKRLHDYNPNCKVLLTLRNPVDRAYSAYLMESNYADIGFPFEKIIDVAVKADVSYWPFQLIIDAGNYAKHLKTVYKHFPKEQVMIVLCDEIKENPVKVCREIFRWLGVDDTFVPEIKVHNPTMKGGPKIYSKFAITLLKKSPWIRKVAGWVIPSYYNYKVGDFVRNLNKTHEKHNAMDAATRTELLKYYWASNKELEEMTGKNVTALWDR